METNQQDPQATPEKPIGEWTGAPYRRGDLVVMSQAAFDGLTKECHAAGRNEGYAEGCADTLRVLSAAAAVRTARTSARQ